MGAVTHAFENLGKTIKHGLDEIGHLAHGVGKVIEGTLSANPKEIANGFKSFGDDIKEVAGSAAGMLDGLWDTSPLGAGLDVLTRGATRKIVHAVTGGLERTVDHGIDGVGQVWNGLRTGHLDEMGKGMLGVGGLALACVPVAGELAAGAQVGAQTAINVSKSLAMSGVKSDAEAAAGGVYRAVEGDVDLRVGASTVGAGERTNG